MLEVGDQVDQRYVVDARLGTGGMAEVYRVKHLSLGSAHALKVLLLPHPGLRERLLREGRIQAQIRHPNVVAVTDVLEIRGRLGLLMEYVDHVSLQQLIDTHGGLPVDQALTLFAYVLSGVSAAHNIGVLHRDLKPANILLARTPQGLIPKITDFGIAKVVMEGAPAGATRDGTMMGTPGYMAPEQVMNAADVDRRADVFALGAVLYATLAGRPAFRPDSQEVFDDTIAGRFEPLDALVPGLPPHVVAAVHQALAPQREDRLADCAAFAAALYPDRPDLAHLATHTLEAPQPILQDGPLTLPEGSLVGVAPGMGAGPGSGETLVPAQAPQPTQAPRDPPKTGRWALAAVGLVGVLLAVGLLTRGPGPQPEGKTGDAIETPAPPTAPEASPTPATTAAEAPATPPAATPGAPEASPTPATPGPSSKPKTSASTPAPEAAPEAAPTAAPEAAPEPAPAAALTIPSVAEATPEPTPAAPEATVPPSGAAAPRLTGTWKGTANRRPATLRISSQSGNNLTAELTLTLGATDKVIELKGSVDPATGALRLEESGGDRMTLTGAIAGDRMSGTYMGAGQSKALAWSVAR